MYPSLLEPPPRRFALPVIPMDIIVDILSRLPVKTLLRFRCLSKQFRCLIDSPDFINRYLQFSSSTPKLILPHYRISLHKNLQIRFLNVNTLDEAYDVEIPLVDSLYEAYDAEMPLDDWLYEEVDIIDCFTDVIGFCDGLLAFSVRSSDFIMLCNISTRKSKTLPICFDDCHYPFCMYGFGRGAGFDDHKLVKVVSSFKPLKTYFSVYSLKTGSWRKMGDFPSYLTFAEMASFVNGTLNWLCWERQPGKGDYYRILSFDLTNDTFYFTALPDSIGGNDGLVLTVPDSIYGNDGLVLTVAGECLCLLEDLNYNWNIWVMKEYGVKDSWIKMYSLLSLPLNIYGLHSFAFSKHVDKLFFIISEDDLEEVVVWDLREGRSEITKPILMSRGFCLTITSEN